MAGKIVLTDSAKINTWLMGQSDELLKRIANMYVAEARLSMRSGGGSRHVPSPPGTPPHVQTGNLRKAVSYERVAPGLYRLGITSKAWYGAIHEIGLEKGGRHWPERPFILPAVRRVQARLRTGAGR